MQLVQLVILQPSINIDKSTLYTYTVYTYTALQSIWILAAQQVSHPDPWANIKVPHVQCVCACAYTHIYTLTYTPTTVKTERKYSQYLYLSSCRK